MIIPAPIDPPQVEEQLWAGFSGTVGWDVGANCGQSVPHMCAAFSRVMCFEPAEESFEALDRIYGQVANIGVRQLAVSDVDGTIELGVLPDQIATGQLVTPGTHGMEWDPATGWDAIPHRLVPARTADTLARQYGRPDFIKVDTEGHELRVLKGAAGLLERGFTSWLIEFHSPDLYSQCKLVLEEAGCETETVRHPHYQPGGAMWRQHGWLRAHAPATITWA
jgi:FkbM family methyltransferase